MVLIKACLLILILAQVAIIKAEEVNEHDIETSPATNHIEEEVEENVPSITNTATSNHNNNPADEVPAILPPGGDNSPPNIFHNFFSQFFRPIRFTGKTYGPSVIAIVGDKPYISLEVFNKFSPFKWLMNAFQGKIQNICGLLSPPMQDDVPKPNRQNILDQLIEQSHRPTTGSRQTLLDPGAIRIYDTPAVYRSAKKTNYI